MILKQCKYIITQDPRRGILADADIRIEGEQIVEIGYGLKGDDVLPCNDKIIIPGFSNCHVHADVCFLNIDLTESRFASEYPLSLIRLERSMSKEIALLSAEALFAESLLRGCTSLVLFTRYPRELQEIAKKVGIRVISGSLVSSMEELRNISNESDTGIYCIYFNELMREGSLNGLRELLQRVKSGRVYVHISETRRAAFEAKKKFGHFPVELLNELGLLTEKTVLVHSGWITSWEIEIVSHSGSSLVYCPSVEMRLATSGFPPLKDLICKGISVGLGTDSLLTGLSLDIVEEARLAILHQRESYKGLVISPKDALDLITISASKLTGMRLGRIQEGYLADLLLIKLKPKFYGNSKRGLVSNIIYRLEYSDIDLIIIGGKLVEISKQRDSILKSINVKLDRLNDLFYTINY